MDRRRIIASVLALVVIGAIVIVTQRLQSQNDTSTYSGTIEADDITISSEVSGVVEKLTVDEGMNVKQGQVLVQLNTDLLNAQLAQAQAAVQVADANRSLVKAGSRSEEVAQSQASVEQAQAQYDGAMRAWQNAQASTVITQAMVQLGGAEQAYANALRNVRNPQELETQISQAQAARDTAQATLGQTRINAQATRDRLSAAKTQAEAIMNAQANALASAQANFAKYKGYWDHIQKYDTDPVNPSVTNPKTGNKDKNKLSEGARQQYYAQLVQAEAAMHQAEQAVSQAQTAFDAARQAEVSGVATADEQVSAAEQTSANAQKTLESLLAIRTTPQQLQAAADNAKAQRDAARTALEAARVQKQSAVDAAYTQLQNAEAVLNQVQARNEQTQTGSRPEQVRAAEAQLVQAQAAAHQIEVQKSKAMITSPLDGIVLERIISRGELAMPSMALLRIGSLQMVRLTIFVPEDRVGGVKLDQKVQVTVDTFPNRTFEGRIAYIAPNAEFTPRNIQTKQERATTVFRVRVDLDNPDGSLKPGMPADARLIEEGR